MICVSEGVVTCAVVVEAVNDLSFIPLNVLGVGKVLIKLRDRIVVSSADQGLGNSRIEKLLDLDAGKAPLRIAVLLVNVTKSHNEADLLRLCVRYDPVVKRCQRIGVIVGEILGVTDYREGVIVAVGVNLFFFIEGSKQTKVVFTALIIQNFFPNYKYFSIFC